MKNNIINTDSLEIFKNNVYQKHDIGYVSNNAYLSVVATNKCQRNCFYCINSDTDKKSDIPINKSVKNIQKLTNKYKIKETIILGGEPLLHNNIFDLIYKLKNKTKLETVRITTNGIKLKNNEEFIEKLIYTGIDGINISYHNEDFMKLYELKWVYKTIKKYNKNIKVRINTNIWKGNNDTLNSLLNMVGTLNFADEIRISNLIRKDSFSVNSINNKLKDNLILSNEKYINLFNKIINYYSKTHTLINNDKTLGFVRYILIPSPVPIIINWNINSDVSKQICENHNREINTFKCLINGEVSLSWNTNHIIK